MDTLKLRRIAKKYGTPGVLFVGTVLAAHNVFKNKRLLLVCGGMAAAALWVAPTLDRQCSSVTSALAPAVGKANLDTSEAAKYEVVEFKPIDGGQFALPFALNNKGAVVGVSDDSDENLRAVIWENGDIKDLGQMGNSEFTIAYGINDRGQAAGGADSEDSVNGFVWENGKFTNVGDLGYPFSISITINNRSQAAGISVTKDYRMRGFVWENGKIKNIGTLPNFGPSIPSDIADNGTLVGNVYDGDGYPHPFVWSGGKINALPKWKENSVPIALNNDSTAVGADFDSEGERVTPVIWHRGKVASLPLPSGFTLGVASDINNSGVIVGTIGNKRSVCPVLWNKGNVIDLSKQVGSDIRLLFAQSINDRGEITAFGVKGEEFVSVLLKPKSRSESMEYNETDWDTAGSVAPVLDLGHEREIMLDENTHPYFAGERDYPFYIYSFTPNLEDTPEATSTTLMKFLVARLRYAPGTMEAMTVWYADITDHGVLHIEIPRTTE